MHSFYSSNFLIISCAGLYGIEYAALLKAIGFCMYGLNYVVQHIIGTGITVAVAHLKGSRCETDRMLLLSIQKKLQQGTALFFIALMAYCLYAHIMHPQMGLEQLHLITVFAALLFSENMVTAREHYYMAKGKAGILPFSNLILLIPYLLCSKSFIAAGPLFFLYLLFAARMSYLVILHQAERVEKAIGFLLQNIICFLRRNKLKLSS
jgi:hypothetical protein